MGFNYKFLQYIFQAGSSLVFGCSLIEGAFTDLRWVREYTLFVPKLKSFFFFFSSILVYCNRWQFWGAGRKGKQSNSHEGMMSKWVPGRHGVFCFSCIHSANAFGCSSSSRKVEMQRLLVQEARGDLCKTCGLACSFAPCETSKP